MLTRERFDAKVRIDWATGCHEWMGAKTGKGYPKFYEKGKFVAAHRWAYEQKWGIIPEGYVAHHVCSQKHCVNPDHVEILAHDEHTAHHRAGITHCKNGHELSEENTYLSPGSRGRNCIICKKRNDSEYYISNVEKIKRYQKEYYKNNREKVINRNKIYRERH